ncbi:hypothetical protein AAK882_02675 [Carnobacteriaceae bacterium 52-44]
MVELFSILITLILLMAVIFAIRIFNKTIQEDIKDFKEKYQLTKRLILKLKKNGNIY